MFHVNGRTYNFVCWTQLVIFQPIATRLKADIFDIGPKVAFSPLRPGLGRDNLICVDRAHKQIVRRAPIAEADQAKKSLARLSCQTDRKKHVTF